MEVEKVIETVVVEREVEGKTVTVVETVVVEKPVTRTEKVVETVVVEKQVTVTEKVVETVVVVQTAMPGPSMGGVPVQQGTLKVAAPQVGSPVFDNQDAVFPTNMLQYFFGIQETLLTGDGGSCTESAQATPNVERVTIDIACPGESARIINVNDLMEPRVKVDGPGTAYPGVCNRSLDTVGSGVTYRLGGLGVVESVTGQRTARVRTSTAEEALKLRQNERPQNFIDMSGPGAITPASSLSNVCVSITAEEGLGPEDEYLATHSATLKVLDGIAESVRDLEPPQVNEYDTTNRDSSLPGVVFICNLMSMEFWAGPDSKMGTAVYGVTRLSAPWLIQPEEMFDGAVSQRVSWHFTNNPIVEELISRHGRDLNFLGCIIQRTNWGGQRDMQLSASRSAQMAKMLGADGAIITTNIRGRRFVDTVLGVQACERAGIRTTLITEEEDDEDGTAPPLLVFTPEMEAIVSTGAGAAGPFPAVERVLGVSDDDGYGEAWTGDLPAIAGRYGAFHLQDYYGYGKQSRVDY